MNRVAARATSAIAGIGLLVAGVVLTGTGTSQASPGDGDVAFTGTGFGPIPDGMPCTTGHAPGPPRDVTFNVTGLVHWAPAEVRVTGLSMHHPWMGDVIARLIAPDGTSHVLFGRTGATTALGVGDGTNLGGTVAFMDGFVLDWWSMAALRPIDQDMPNGNYATSVIGGAGSTGAITSLTGAFSAVADANGTWTLRITDGCSGDMGDVSAATLELVSAPPCTPEHAAVTAAQAKVASTAAAKIAAASAAANADLAVQLATSSLVKAQQAFDKAKKKLKQAKRTGKPVQIKRAKAKVKKAGRALKTAKAELTTAQHTAATAHQTLTSAEAAAAAAQAELAAAQAALASC